MNEKLEDLVAQDKVRYFKLSRIPVGKDGEATKKKYGFSAVHDFMVRPDADGKDSTVFYTKQTALDAGLAPQPNGSAPSGIEWEDFPTPLEQTEEYKSSLLTIRDCDEAKLTGSIEELKALAKVVKYLLNTLPEIQNLS